jgi:DNA-binding HxlR family transcriptional regulator
MTAHQESTPREDSTSRVDTELPKQLNSSGAKLVYFYLNRVGGATIEELQAALDLQQLTLYSLLQTLTNHGLVDQTGSTYVCHAQSIEGEKEGEPQ